MSCTCVCLSVCLYVCVYMYMYVCVCIYIYVYICIYIYIYIYDADQLQSAFFKCAYTSERFRKSIRRLRHVCACIHIHMFMIACLHMYTQSTNTHSHCPYMRRCIGGCDALLRELLGEDNRNIQRTFAQQGPPVVLPHTAPQQGA